MLNTLVYNNSVHNGLQSVLFVPRDEHGPLRTLTNTNFEHMGLSMGPCEQLVLIYTLHQFSVINSVSFAHPSSWWPWPS